MRITINPVLDMETLQWVSNDGVYEYSGPIARLCSSGDSTARTNEANMQKLSSTLASDYAQTFANQQSVLNGLNAKLNYLAANPLGLSRTQIANAKTSINENTAKAVQQAVGAAGAYAASHGGADLGSGPAGEIAGQIASEGAQSKAQQLANLSNENEAIKNENRWKAISGLGDVASGYGSAAGIAADAAPKASEASTYAGNLLQSTKSSGWGHLGSVISGIAGLVNPAMGVASEIGKIGGNSANAVDNSLVNAEGAAGF